MSTTHTPRAPQGFGFRLKLFGIPVTVEITFILIALALGANRRTNTTLLIEWIAVVFFSILVHEFGHAFVGRAFGLEPEIRLYAFGGLTSWSAGRDITPGKSMLLSAAGPCAGFLLGGLVLLLSLSLGTGASLVARNAFKDLLWVNIGWGVLNLLPIRPLDGGNIAFSLEELLTGSKKGTITLAGSLALASAAALWALSAGEYWILILTGLMAVSNGQQLFLILKTRLDQPLRSRLDEAWRRAAAGQHSAALEIAGRELRRARSDEAKREAGWILVAGYYQQGNLERATEELKRLQALFAAGAFRPFGDELDRVRCPLFLGAAFELSRSPAIGYWYCESLISAKGYDDAFDLCSRPELREHSAALYRVLQSAAFHDGRYDVSAKAGELAFAHEPRPEIAYNVACALARQSKFDNAIEWLNTALERGFNDWDILNTDPDLDALRRKAPEEFEKLMASRVRPPG